MRRCMRLTRHGLPCRRELHWYEDACLYHATSDEHWNAIRRLRQATIHR